MAPQRHIQTSAAAALFGDAPISAHTESKPTLDSLFGPADQGEAPAVEAPAEGTREEAPPADAEAAAPEQGANAEPPPPEAT